MSNVIDIPSSPYAKFFVKFKGKNFIKNGEVIPKFMVWEESAKGFMLLHSKENSPEDKLNTFLSKRFLIQDKPGWKNGGIIDREVAHAYYYGGLHGVKENYPQKYERWIKMNQKTN